MMVSLFLALASFFSFDLSFTQSYQLKLGDETVTIQQINHGQGKAFIHVHQNETTALAAAMRVVQSEGGSLLTLKHSGSRNIVFHFEHKRYEFDPNRIFTDEGIVKTLKAHGAYSKGAHQQVKKLANKLKALLPTGKVIAVHNNQSYSFRDYLPGHPLASDAKALHFRNRESLRNFYLVTNMQDFSRLKQYNAILQKHAAEDDGSLSIYLASKQYINVEAGYGQLETQVRMLKSA